MANSRRILIACSMMEDEINAALTKRQKLPVVWMDRGFHNEPEKLKKELQRQIDSLQDYDEILCAFGLCGNGTDGISSRHARIILPKFDDCVNLMLCTGTRIARGLTRPDSLYFTRGWTRDDESVLRQYEELGKKYDDETRDAVLEMMYEHYNTVTVIDTGCYDTAPVAEYARRAADLLGLNVEMTTGSNRILQQLLDECWDDNFIILEPGEVLSPEHFEFYSKGGK